MNGDFYSLPPPGPPPLLSPDDIKHLAFQGWLPVHLPDHLLTALSDLSSTAAAYFDRQYGVKRAQYPPSRGTECGFYRVPGEKEYITLRHSVHGVSALEQHARQVWHEAGILLHRILCDLSRAGGYSDHVWEYLLENSLDLPADGSEMEDVTTLMRLFRYYPTAGTADEHVDIGLLTLCVGHGKGLQVLNKSQDPPAWVDAEGPVVLVGDFARALMRNQIRAGVHRVVGNPAGRSSIVFALRPYLKHPTDLSAFGGQGVVDTRKHFTKIKGSKFNVNARRDVRERQLRAQKERDALKNDERLIGNGHG